MPNGDVSGGGFPVVDILEGPEVPGTGVPTGPVGTFIESIVSFFGGLFGGGANPPAPAPVPLPAPSIFEGVSPFFPFGGISLQQQIRQFEIKARPPAPSPITGREAIPTPAEGGPPLITERFETLPPILDVPGLVQEEEVNMPVDVPLLTSSFLPALRQATTPAVTGFLGGLAQDVVSGLFARPIGELGLGQLPMTQQVATVQGRLCPPEKPSTRILRQIKAATGVSINLSRAKSLIRELGLEHAARCLAISAQEVCQLLIVASPRRRRGISASDIRIVKRTARRFENLKHDLGHLGGRAGPHHHRRRTTRHK